MGDLTEIPKRKHKTKQGKAKFYNLERTHRERSRMRGGERMIIINFSGTREGFRARDVINSVKCQKQQRKDDHGKYITGIMTV